MRARYSAPPDLTDSAATRSDPPGRSRGGGGGAAGPRRPTSTRTSLARANEISIHSLVGYLEVLVFPGSYLGRDNAIPRSPPDTL